MRSESRESIWPVSLHATRDAAVVTAGDGVSWRVTDPRYLDVVASLTEIPGSASPSALPAAAVASLVEATQVKPMSRPPLRVTRFSGESIALPTPPEPDGSFQSVLDRRVSRRELGPFDLARLAGLLFTSARIRAFDERLGSSRPAPSAGACHPFDLLVAAQHVEGLSPGWWWFDPWTCMLHGGRQRLEANEYLESVRDAAETPSRIPAAIVLMANIDRTLERYPNGLTLVWRDAGALLAVMQLSATSYHLSSCIVSTSGALSRGTSTSTVQDLGALIVGSLLA